MFVGSDGDTSSHVTDNQVEVLILLADLSGIATSDSTLVQGMPDTDTVHQWRAADTGIVIELIHHTRVGDKRATARYLVGNLIGNQTAQVTGVVVHRNAAMGVLHHFLVDLIDTALQGFHQSASSDDGLEVEGHLRMAEFVDDHLLAVVQLFDDVIEVGQLLRGVVDTTQ